MFAEIIPGAYDFHGRKIFSPRKRRHRVFHPTFPMGLFVRSQLTEKCRSTKEIRKFLSKCKYVPDQEQFKREDYWMPPDEFEEKKRGDCEDFALWTWRQLMDLGFSCRFVAGYSGKYGEGHAWLTAEKDNKRYIVEPLACHVGERLPRLSLVRHRPEISVEWDGKKLHYFEHIPKVWRPSIWELTSLVSEWLLFYTGIIVRVIIVVLLLPFLLARKVFLKRAPSKSR